MLAEVERADCLDVDPLLHHFRALRLAPTPKPEEILVKLVYIALVLQVLQAGDLGAELSPKLRQQGCFQGTVGLIVQSRVVL